MRPQVVAVGLFDRDQLLEPCPQRHTFLRGRRPHALGVGPGLGRRGLRRLRRIGGQRLRLGLRVTDDDRRPFLGVLDDALRGLLGGHQGLGQGRLVALRLGQLRGVRLEPLTQLREILLVALHLIGESVQQVVDLRGGVPTHGLTELVVGDVIGRQCHGSTS